MDRQVNTVRGDLDDLELLIRALNEYEVDTVFHLGAQTIVGTAVRSPLSTFEANIRGTWNLLEAIRLCPKLVSRVIVASSDKAYGAHGNLAYTEETPLQGTAPYDVSKSCADLIAQSYFKTFAMPIVITRCANLFGGGDLNFNRLIPGTIRSGLLGERPIIRSDGTPVRDYLFVRDAVAAYILLAEQFEYRSVTGEAFNFGLQTPMTVREVVQRVLEATGSDLEPVIVNEVRHEIPTQYMDCTKARDTLGWSPSIMFADGLRETVNWYRSWLNHEPVPQASEHIASTQR
jgi:CDP-glucose 4,6-dehydratase